MTTKDRVSELAEHWLGDADEESKLALEKAALEDDALFEELIDAEEQIVDAYAADELPEAMTERMDRVVESSQRLTTGMALARSLGEGEREIPPSSPLTRGGWEVGAIWGWVLLAVVVMVLVIWVLV